MPDIAWPIDSIWRIRSAAVNMSQRASASQSYDGQPSRFIVSKTTGSSPMERIRTSHGLACRLEIEVELDESITLTSELRIAAQGLDAGTELSSASDRGSAWQ
jgi:hypothetical protein